MDETKMLQKVRTIRSKSQYLVVIHSEHNQYSNNNSDMCTCTHIQKYLKQINKYQLETNKHLSACYD